jgi:hypothetical protein
VAAGLGRNGTEMELSDMVTAARGAAGADATRAPQMDDERSAPGAATAEKLLTKAIMVARGGVGRGVCAGGPACGNECGGWRRTGGCVGVMLRARPKVYRAASVRESSGAGIGELGLVVGASRDRTGCCATRATNSKNLLALTSYPPEPSQCHIIRQTFL